MAILVVVIIGSIGVVYGDPRDEDIRNQLSTLSLCVFATIRGIEPIRPHTLCMGYGHLGSSGLGPMSGQQLRAIACCKASRLS